MVRELISGNLWRWDGNKSSGQVGGRFSRVKAREDEIDLLTKN